MLCVSAQKLLLLLLHVAIKCTCSKPSRPPPPSLVLRVTNNTSASSPHAQHIYKHLYGPLPVTGPSDDCLVCDGWQVVRWVYLRKSDIICLISFSWLCPIKNCTKFHFQNVIGISVGRPAVPCHSSLRSSTTTTTDTVCCHFC